MRTRLIALTLLTVFAVSEVAVAAPLGVTREDQKDVMVTIYNGNLGLVKDVREARFPAGVTEIQFMDVAAQIDPTTVHLKSLTDPAGLKILEQNYEYDLLTSQKLMEKYVGKKVRLYQGDGTFHEAKLLSTNGPIFEINGQIHMGHYGRLVLPSLPGGRWCGGGAPRRPGPSGWKPPTSRAGSPGRPTTSWSSTPPTRSATS